MTAAEFRTRVRELRPRIAELTNDVNLLLNGAGLQTSENIEHAVHALDIAELLLERAATASEGQEHTP